VTGEGGLILINPLYGSAPHLAVDVWTRYTPRSSIAICNGDLRTIHQQMCKRPWTDTKQNTLELKKTLDVSRMFSLE